MMSPSDKRKQSLYFPESMLVEIQQEATRLDRSLSWVMQRAWKLARADIRKLPSVNDVVDMEASGEERVKAVLDVLQTMLVRRKIDLKALKPGEPRISGKIWKLTATMQQDISGDDARKIAKLIRDEGPKGVRTQVQGDELRVFSKKRDDLQACQRLIQAADYDFAVQFANYR